MLKKKKKTSMSNALALNVTNLCFFHLDPHLDTIEIAVYASVERDDLSCTCPTIDNLSDANFSNALVHIFCQMDASFFFNSNDIKIDLNIEKNICELPEFMTEEGIHCLQVADAMSRFMRSVP